MESAQKYSEPELVALLREKSQPVFHYLYEHYSGALYSIILGIVRDEELAKDVLQEVFVKIWKQVDSYDAGKGRLFTWMLNIARNASIDVVRSKAYQQNLHNKELNEETRLLTGITESKTDHIGLRKLVHHLKEDYRLLIELAYFQGYTQDEMSKMLSIPLGTVKTRLRSALIQLREMIKP